MYMCNLGEEMSNEAITLCLSEPSLLIIFPFCFYYRNYEGIDCRSIRPKYFHTHVPTKQSGLLLF